MRKDDRAGADETAGSHRHRAQQVRPRGEGGEVSDRAVVMDQDADVQLAGPADADVLGDMAGRLHDNACAQVRACRHVGVRRDDRRHRFAVDSAELPPERRRIHGERDLQARLFDLDTRPVIVPAEPAQATVRLGGIEQSDQLEFRHALQKVDQVLVHAHQSQRGGPAGHARTR